jgi:ABC-type Fe2+-enterobactin transport system substrate-binding protein
MPQSEGGNFHMSAKILSTAIVTGLLLAFTAPAFAEDAPAVPTTKADCEKAKGTWDDATSTCTMPK